MTASFDKATGANLAGSLLGRTSDGRLVIEARRPASDHYLMRVSHDIATSPAGQVARATFDQSDGSDPMTWVIPAPFAERLTEALANQDDGAVLRLVADQIRNQHKEN